MTATTAGGDTAADLLAAVPPPAVVPTVEPAAVDAPPARKRSGTSGAERRRRAKAEAAGLPTTASGARNRATGDKPPAKGKAPAAAATASEIKALADGLDELLPWLALKDPYTAAVVAKRRKELAGALYEIPVLRDVVRWAAKLQGGANNPYVIVLSVVLPILAHHGKLPAKPAGLVQLGSALLKLEPTEDEIATMQARGMAQVIALTQLGDLVADVAAEADAERAKADAA